MENLGTYSYSLVRVLRRILAVYLCLVSTLYLGLDRSRALVLRGRAIEGDIAPAKSLCGLKAWLLPDL